MDLQIQDVLDLDLSKVDAELLHQKVVTSIGEILRSRFPDSTARQGYREYSDRINFACPVCGDSMTDSRKKRGNLYSNFTYKCFNCGAYHEGLSFWKHAESLGLYYNDNFTKIERLYIKKNVQSKWVARVGTRSIDPTEDFDDINKSAIPRSLLLKKAGWHEPQNSSKAMWYLGKNRNQIDRPQDWKKFAYDSKSDAIVILNLTRNERVVGAQLRRFGGGAKYLTMDFKKLLTDPNYLGVQNPQQNVIEALQPFSTLFGFFQINWNMPVTIFEGAFDAFRFPNGIATAGVNKDIDLDFSNVRYFQDNDSSGKRQAMEKLKDGYSVFLWTKLIQDYGLQERKIKDLSDLLKYIHANQVNWNNYFSTDKLDIAYL